MKKSLRSMLGAVSSVLLIGLFVLASAPAWARTTEERIKALEEELGQLKGEQTQLKEDAEDAKAAAAKLPSFRYRPGAGMFITAPDKSWAFRFFFRYYVYVYNKTDGNDRRGASTMDQRTRRNRPAWTLWWDDNFYEIRHTQTYDTGGIGNQQNADFRIHLEKLNPYFPMLAVHDEGGFAGGFVARSSARDAVVEYTRDLLGARFDTLSDRGISLLWNRAPMPGGTFTAGVEYKPGVGVKEDELDDSDNPSFEFVLGSRPFSKTKNKWLRSLKLGVNYHVDSVDTRSAESGTADVTLRETNRGGSRITVFRTTNAGKGLSHYVHWGVEWGAGPYFTRVNGGFASYDGDAAGGVTNIGSVRGRVWGIHHRLMLWSPKGLLTGSTRKPGSLYFGYRFARADAHCGDRVADCNREGIGNSNHFYENEWDIWYVLRPSLNVGLWITHASAPNVDQPEQVTIGCSSNTGARDGKGCDWTSINFGLRSDW